MTYLAPAAGGTLIDVSCGTGLFTRLFARSQRFKGVVALDFRCVAFVVVWWVHSRHSRLDRLMGVFEQPLTVE
jgi:predicted methyltransferase